MKKNALVIAALMLPLLFSCEKETPAPTDGGNGPIFKVTLENGRTWRENDKVLVNGVTYSIPSEDFGTSNTANLKNVPQKSNYYAAYDYGEGTISDHFINLNLPQEFTPGKELRPMIGYSNDNEMLLKNLLGFIKLKFTGDATIKTVTLTSIDTDLKLSGAASADMDFAATPVMPIAMAADANTFVKVNLGEGLNLSSGNANVVIPVPPLQYADGFRLLITDSDGQAMEYDATQSIVIRRGEETSLDIEYVPGSEAPFSMKCGVEPSAFGQMVNWNSSDAICVNGTTYTLLTGAGNSSAEFGPVMPAESYVIVSPAKAYSKFSTNYASLNIPSSQSFGAPINTVNPQVAVTTDSEAEATLKFVEGIVAVKVSGNCIIDNIQLISKDGKALSGKMDVTFSGSDFTTEMTNDSKSKVTLECPNGASISETKEFTFAVPAGEYNQGFRLVLTNTRRQVQAFETGAIVVRRNEKVDLDKISWNPSVDDPGNLSAMGWANCYIVSQDGKYTFETKLIDGTTIRDIAKVDWLWANSIKGNPNTLVSDISYENGVVTFHASSDEGNVLLAAFNNSNEILWSWHIWLTDNPKTVNLQNMSPKDPTKGFFMMDRNLGATSCSEAEYEESFGLFYQWGRKDPFYGGFQPEYDKDEEGKILNLNPFKNALTGTVCNSNYPQAKWSAEMVDASKGNMEFATKNPMLFIAGAKDDNGYCVNDICWLSKDNPMRKVSGAEDSEMWNPFKKTIYDPCPAGYQTPRNGTFSEFATTKGKWTVNYSGFNFTSDSGETLWFPAQGVRISHPDEAGALSRVNVSKSSSMGLWTSELFTSFNNCYSFSLQIETSMVFPSNDQFGWANGLNVRCVKNYEYK